MYNEALTQQDENSQGLLEKYHNKPNSVIITNGDLVGFKSFKLLRAAPGSMTGF